MSRCDLAAVWLEADGEMITCERLRLDTAGRLRDGENTLCIPNPAHTSQDTELEAAELTAVIFSAASQAHVQVDRVIIL